MSSTKKEIKIIAAYSENRIIGKDGKIPWRIPEDIKRFKDLTIPHPVIMGRKTYESIPDKFKPLPQRQNIVLSKSSDFSPGKGVIVARSLNEAIEKAHNIDNEVFVIGGQNIYEQALPLSSRMYLTEIKLNYQGDSFFPEFDKSSWEEIKRECFETFCFVDYVRKH